MNTSKAILIGFALVAAAVYFSRDVGPAQADNDPDFAITGTGVGIGIWRAKSITGQVSYCEPGGNRTGPPVCSPWSK